MSPNYIGEQRKTGKFNKLSTVFQRQCLQVTSVLNPARKKQPKREKKKKYKKLMDHFYRNLLYVQLCPIFIREQFFSVPKEKELEI